MPQGTTDVTDGKAMGEKGDRNPLPALLDAQQVARLLNCSPRTVRRLADAGRIPAPVRLGRLVRWSRRVLDDWIADGCPSCKTGR